MHKGTSRDHRHCIWIPECPLKVYPDSSVTQMLSRFHDIEILFNLGPDHELLLSSNSVFAQFSSMFLLGIVMLSDPMLFICTKVDPFR